MKKKFIFTIALAAAMLTSCDMNKAPIGYIDQDKAIESAADAQSFRNGLYSGLRAVTSSGFVTRPEIQADMFNGLTVNGNRLGPVANGNILSNTGDVTDYWGALYGQIGDVNFFLEYGNKLRDKLAAANDSIQLVALDRYLAEAHFLRGYYYAITFDRWCQLYTAERANEPYLGLPIVTEFAPSMNRDTYKPRATMKETIDFFMNELDLGYKGMKKWEDLDRANASAVCAPNSTYLSSWVAVAMKARVQLWIGNYAEAQKYAQEVIDSKVYTLATTANFANMWTKDTGTEIMYAPYVSTSELCNSMGGVWLNAIDGADYIPASTLVKDLEESGVDLLGRPADVRYNTYLAEKVIRSNYGNIKALVFNKYPGNSSFMTSSTPNYVNKPKPFRLSEMYLIVAESAAMQGLDEVAMTTMNAFLKNRINRYTDRNYAGNELVTFIRKQRGIELCGEGYRISDLRRWHQGFDRQNGAIYDLTPEVSTLLTPAGLEVKYEANDHRYTWPIPAREIQTNPQMADQQNPGY